MPYPRLIALLVMVGCLSGCATFYTSVLQNPRSTPRQKVDALEGLQHCGWEDATIDAITDLLSDKDAGVRVTAAATCKRYQTNRRNLIALVRRLDDAEVGYVLRLSSFLFFSVEHCVGSVRAQAYLSLTRVFSQDFGFDQKKWMAEVDKKYPPDSQRRR